MQEFIREPLKPEDLPYWVQITAFLKEKLEQDSEEISPWLFADRKFFQASQDWLQNLYKNRTLFCFAHREDSDDIACFEMSKPGKVIIVHNAEEPGFEAGPEFVSFEAWYEYAKNVDYGDLTFTNVQGIDYNPWDD